MYYDFFVGDVRQHPSLWSHVHCRIPARSYEKALDHFVSVWGVSVDSVMQCEIYALRSRVGHTVLRFESLGTRRLAPIPESRKLAKKPK